jgi:isoprenylcysteine carboxyl methyltransferase (ICMT) family protein YpbQ
MLRLRAHRALREAGVTDEQFRFLHPPSCYTRKGPYRWLTHPAYYGSLLIFAGAGMLCLGWGGFVIALASWPFYEDRIHFETSTRKHARERRVDGA